MDRTEKERVVAELVERLRATDSLIVADYRGLTNAQLVELRAKLRGSGARLSVVKNTLTRRAAEEAGTEALLALLEGPTAIAFVEAEGDPVAVAKALADAAKDTKVLALRGGLLSGQTLSGAEVEELAKLPAPEIVKSQLVGVIVAPLTQLAALLAAPLRDLVGLVDARIAQLGDSAGAESPEGQASPEPEGATVDEVVPGDSPDAESPADQPATEADGAVVDDAAIEGTREPDHLADSASAESAGTEEE
jgi:large subunit ribosomal protein L10